MADVSLSLDIVLAVEGIASDDVTTLVFGEGVSVLLKAVATTAGVKKLEHCRRVGFVGFAILFWVAGRVLREGWLDASSGWL